MRSTESVRNEIIGVGLLWAALAALSGCGGPTSRAPGTVVEACRGLHTAIASRSARCQGGSVADWQANLDGQEDCSAYADHVAAHQVEYRPAGYADCLAEYDKPCDQPTTFCAYDVLHGLVPDGQPCPDTEVCGTTSACFPIGTTIGTSSCGGQVCVRLAVENEVCGLWCGGTTPCLAADICAPGLACVKAVCVKARGLGESCGPSDPTTCDSLLFCSADPNDPQSSGTCQARTVGGACHVDADCPGDQFCAQGTCTARRAIGSTCADAPTSCMTWNTCDAATGTCVAAGRLGQPCAPYPGSPGTDICFSGACFIGPADTQCVAYPSRGGSCGADSTTPGICAPGDMCDATTTTCVAVACP